MKVIGIGDNVCDKYEHLQTMYPGGQAMNFAMYATMCGAESAFLGVFGTDDVAAHNLSTLDEMGIDHSRCRIHEGKNGYARVTLVNGDRVFLGSNKGGVTREHPIRLDGEDMAYIHTFSHVHTTNNSYLDDELPGLKDAGLSVSYDFSKQWEDEERVKRVAPFIRYAFLSCGSMPEREIGEICADLVSRGCNMAIATMGERGSLLFNGKEYFRREANLVQAVDTLGAGDSFATAFLIELLRLTADKADENPALTAGREQIMAAMTAGANLAARVCLMHGACEHGKQYDVSGE